MLITDKVEIKITKSNLNYFKEKGYFCELYSLIEVNPLDLPKQSERKIIYKCDNCKKEFELNWCDYIKKRNRVYSELGDFCNKCAKQKRKEWYLKYNPDKYKKIYKEAREKAKKTCLNKYGVENVMQVDDFKNNLIKSIEEKYGVKNIMQLPETKEKIALTLGTNQEFQEIKNKKGNIYYRYKGIPCSKNQIHLQEILGGELNKYIDYYNLDIVFEEEKIYLEYDGSGHDLSVKLGKKTKEEQEKYENIRYFYLKEKGYKQIKLISLTKRKLPDDEIIKDLVYKAKDYLKKENNYWIEFNIDNNFIKGKEYYQKYTFDYILTNNF